MKINHEFIQLLSYNFRCLVSTEGRHPYNSGQNKFCPKYSYKSGVNSRTFKTLLLCQRLRIGFYGCDS